MERIRLIRHIWIVALVMLCAPAWAAFDQIAVKGATSRIIEVQLRSATTGMGATGVAHTAVTASYTREGGTRQAITLAAGTAGDAWSSGKWAEIDATNCKGLYQLHLPDAALVTGADAVTVSLQATGVIDKSFRVVLIDANLRDAAGLGLSRLDAAVGTRATQTSVDAIDDYVDTEVAAILEDTGAMDTADELRTLLTGGTGPLSTLTAQATWEYATRTLTAPTNLGIPAAAPSAADNAAAVWGAGTREITGGVLPWQASWDAEAQSEAADALAAFFTSTDALVTQFWAGAVDGAVSGGEALKRLLAAVFNTAAVSGTGDKTIQLKDSSGSNYARQTIYGNGSGRATTIP